MEILNFINSHENWESLLTSDPYNLKIKWEDNYFILTYDMIKTDFNIKLTHEARGSIFYKADDGKITCVCRPFTKFFNYGEPYAAKIDWSSARITEKIDGSLIKFWYHNGEWHMSTNGCIDAFKAPTATDATFGLLIQKKIFSPLSWKYLAEKCLSKEKTHLFEFTSPDNQVVLKYPKASLWYLTSIDITGKESFELEPKELMNSAFKCEIVFPRQFDLKTLDDVIEQAEMLGEGCVVSDAFGNRIKVKSTDYVLKHKFLNNKKIDEYAIAWYIKESRIDDFLSLFPEYNELYGNVIKKICIGSNRMRNIAQSYLAFDTKKDVALAIKMNNAHKPFASYIFSSYQDKCLPDAFDYFVSLSKRNTDELLELWGITK